MDNFGYFFDLPKTPFVHNDTFYWHTMIYDLSIFIIIIIIIIIILWPILVELSLILYGLLYITIL